MSSLPSVRIRIRAAPHSVRTDWLHLHVLSVLSVLEQVHTYRLGHAVVARSMQKWDGDGSLKVALTPERQTELLQEFVRATTPTPKKQLKRPRRTPAPAADSTQGSAFPFELANWVDEHDIAPEEGSSSPEDVMEDFSEEEEDKRAEIPPSFAALADLAGSAVSAASNILPAAAAASTAVTRKRKAQFPEDLLPAPTSTKAAASLPRTTAAALPRTARASPVPAPPTRELFSRPQRPMATRAPAAVAPPSKAVAALPRASRPLARISTVSLPSASQRTNECRVEANDSDQDEAEPEELPLSLQAIVPIVFREPLDECVPYHPRVRSHLDRYGIAVVQPAYRDQLSLVRELNSDLLQHQAYSRAYRMSLSCINDGSSDQVTDPSAPDVQATPPTADSVFAFLERVWAHMCDGRPLPRNLATENCLYLKDLSAVQDVRSPAVHPSFFPAFDQRLAALDEDPMDTSDSAASSPLRRVATTRFAVHPLYQNEFALHPHSLLRLSSQWIDGVNTAYAYLKHGFQFFNLHIEQLLMPFVHHQLCGESVWILIPNEERHKVDRLVQHMAHTQVEWRRRRKRCHKGAVVGDPEHARSLSRVLLYSKSLFPPLSLLEKHRIRYHRIRLKAGQVLIVHGGFAHYGFSTDAGETHSFACNIMTEQWLLTGGPDFVCGFFEWVLRLKDVPEDHLSKHLAALGMEVNQLANALNMCPPAYTCSLLGDLQTDLKQYVLAKLSPSDASSSSFSYSLTLEQAETAVSQLHRALALLHDARVREFLQRHYVDAHAQLCECSPQEASSSTADGESELPTLMRRMYSYMERSWPLISTSGDLLAEEMEATRARTQQLRNEQPEPSPQPAVSIGYGCTTAASWSKVLDFISSDAVQPSSLRLARHSRFLDIGSGIGQVVLHTQLAKQLSLCVGIEVVRQRHAASEDMLGQLRTKRLADKPLLGDLDSMLVDDRLDRVRFVHDAIDHRADLLVEATHVFMCDRVFHPDTHRFLLPRLCADRRRVVITCLPPNQIATLCDGFQGEPSPYVLVGQRPLTLAGSGQGLEAYIYVTTIWPTTT